MSDLLSIRCRHCGQTARRLLLLAMTQLAGAHVHPSPDQCSGRDDGGDHDFTQTQAKEIA